MYIELNNKKIEIKECNKFKDRLIGNMFTKNIKGLLFENCNSIHTFFMFDKIDLIMLNSDNIIVKTYNNVKPFRIIHNRRATKVIELSKNSLGKIEKHQKLNIIE